MLITLEPGADRGNVLRALLETRTAAENLGSSQGGAQALHAEYLAWVNTARARLRRQISSTDLDRLVTTARYSTLLSLQIPQAEVGPAQLMLEGGASIPLRGPGPVAAALRQMIALETSEHVQRLSEALASLTAWSERLGDADRSGRLVIAERLLPPPRPAGGLECGRGRWRTTRA
ncbi:MAG: hypothetical protein JWP34_5096 [Massilia sp.]|nr:hypothetical protein [Massilia sp.]